MTKVIDFAGITFNRIEPNKVLSEAIGKLDEVVVIGFTKEEHITEDDNGFYCASSTADVGTVLLMIEKFKQQIMEGI